MFNGYIRKILSLFRAAPVTRKYVDSADLFRVLCVLLIAWFHIWQQSWLNPNFTLLGCSVNIYPLVTCGYMFVDCMILLSGFLLMLGKLNNRNDSVRNFFTARISRIIPCYYFFLVFQLLLIILPEKLFANTQSGIIDTLSHLTFTHNLFPEGYTGSRFNGVLWTLAVEFQFYILFPFIGKFFRKRPIFTWSIMTIVAFLSRWYIARYFSDTSLYFNRLPAMLDVYANGMMAAVIWVRLSKHPTNDLRAWISTLLIIPCCYVICRVLIHQRTFSDYNLIRQNQMNDRFLLSVASAALLIVTGRSIKLIRILCSNRIIRFLSGISFNFYMWHQFIAVYLKKWRIPSYTAAENPNMSSEQPWQLLYTLVCFAAGIAVSALLTYLVEKPCSRVIKSHFILDKNLPKRYNKNT